MSKAGGCRKSPGASNAPVQLARKSRTPLNNFSQGGSALRKCVCGAPPLRKLLPGVRLKLGLEGVDGIIALATAALFVALLLTWWR